MSLVIAALAFAFAAMSQAKAQGVTTQDAGVPSVINPVFDGAVNKDVSVVDFAAAPSSAIASKPVPVSLAGDGSSGTSLPTYNAVPEPATFALIGLGGLALLLNRRRRA